MRVAVFIGPVDRLHHHPALVHLAAASRRRDAAARLRDRRHHALARGWLHRAAPAAPPRRRAYTLTARERDEVYTRRSGDTDANGVVAPKARGSQAVRAPSSRKAWFADNVQKPTAAELEEAHHHAEHEHELQAALDHAADGHQFDGHSDHTVDEAPLRGH